MMRHLDSARLELQRALEGHGGACELDQLTRFALEAVRAINAARRELLFNRLNKPKRDPGAPGRHLEVLP